MPSPVSTASMYGLLQNIVTRSATALLNVEIRSSTCLLYNGAAAVATGGAEVSLATCVLVGAAHASIDNTKSVVLVLSPGSFGGDDDDDDVNRKASTSRLTVDDDAILDLPVVCR